MQNIAADMSGGIAQLVAEQKEVEGNLRVTLAQFDTVYELVVDAEDVQDFPEYTLVPRGGTALLDGLGKALAHVEETSDDDDLVIVAVITDGEENSSTEWNLEDVKARVEKLTEAGWNFTFLGANIDSFAAAAGLGFAAASTINYAHTGVGAQSVTSTLGSHVSGLRTNSVKTIAYSGDERAAATEDAES